MSIALREADTANFETLRRAQSGGDLGLLSAVRRSDGADVALVCAVGREGGEHVLTPLAVMVEGNPYETFAPPAPAGRTP